MPTPPFSGPGKRISLMDVAAAARTMGVELAGLQAVMTVETGSGSGFLDDGTGRPKALLESKRFGDYTGHRFDASHPLISTRATNWKLYLGGAAEYDRIAEAVALDRDAALQATSWGLFQIMGSNFALLGYPSADAMVAAFVADELAHLQGFIAFCDANRLTPLLAAKAWDRFAALYNGPDYQVNNYAQRLATAYATARGATYAFLTLGSSGPAVVALQQALNARGFPLVVDGSFGPATAYAVRRFQSSRGLTVDGLPGPRTMAALAAPG